MLFDLRGRRRRVVQVVYLTLALLLGGGLVLFDLADCAVQGGLGHDLIVAYARSASDRTRTWRSGGAFALRR